MEYNKEEEQLQLIKQELVSHMDFPKKGINFRDITPLFLKPEMVEQLVNMSVRRLNSKGVKVDAVAGLESRGFLLGVAIAQKLQVPFIIIRKAGKLPGNKHKVSYGLEYGQAEVEVQQGHIQPDWQVVVHDDLLATGGTAGAAAKLIQMSGAKVAAFNFIIELDGLGGQQAISQYSQQVDSLIVYKD